MKVYFEEKQYARCKALGLSDAEISFILSKSSSTIQNFKSEMDFFEYNHEFEESSEHKVVNQYKKRIKKWREL